MIPTARLLELHKKTCAFVIKIELLLAGQAWPDQIGHAADTENQSHHGVGVVRKQILADVKN